jgi:Holliday junction resolvasome RuvABC endonuclease subunit
MGYGRKRVLSDEERAENKRIRDSRRIQFYTPDGLKEMLQGFAESKKKDINTILISLINKDEEFKKYKTAKTSL